MNTLRYLLLWILIIPIQCFSQTSSIIIKPELDKIRKTNVCTEFQYDHCITKSTATVNSDTLKISLFDQSPSTYDDLNIYIVAEKLISTYKTVYFQSGGKNEWIPIRQVLSINSKDFKKGRKIKGKIDVAFQEILIDDKGQRKETRVIEFSGEFAAKIK